jgi:NTE family protein
LFLVADAGVARDPAWVQKIPGPGGPALAMSIANASLSAATRSGYDAMRGEMRRWQEQLIDWRCALPASEVRRLRGSLAGWDCRDVKLFVGQAGADALPGPMRDELNAVPTRLRLRTEEVDLSIEAGRIATQATPEFNGFIAALETNSVEDRIAAGIARGGRRITPTGN